MYVPKCLHHATRVKRVVAAMKKDEHSSLLFTEELLAYFENFQQVFLGGELAEQEDTVLFKTGENIHDFPFYLWLRGTVRAENPHQKMKTAMGPWGVGARTGHMLLVLICYQYNVKSHIQRCGAYNFGHCELHLIDRIQNRVKDIFNILVWPRHKNISYFTGKKDFISVGIGPMCYDEQYVHVLNTPDSSLKGDHFFIAKQMKLRYPLLHIGSPIEIQFFTELMMENPNPSVKNFCILARYFKDKSDGIHIFPKKIDYAEIILHDVRENADIKSTLQSLDPSVAALLAKLFNTRISSDNGEILPATHIILH